MSPSQTAPAQERRKSRPRARRSRPGDIFGELTLVAYVEPPASGDTRALFACSCGSRKTLQLRNVVGSSTAWPTRDCADRQIHPDPRSQGEAITAGTMHKRLAARHGSASTHPCALCTKTGRGNVYSYRHTSDQARSQLTGKDRKQIYSVEDQDYWILCRRCHSRFDRNHTRTVAKGTLSLFHVTLGMAYAPGPIQPPPDGAATPSQGDDDPPVRD